MSDFGDGEDALEHLASIDLIELCNEAKIERCRATRDLSSCRRYVQHVLSSCGHASLCAECSQRCDVCPICRTSISNSGGRVRLRLYYKCIEAGLISNKHDDRFQEKEETGEYMMADIQRLYSLFDVALENNLVSLVCHYVTDVCMDENAVSSDPVLAFLLDEVVVKDWCKRTFKIIINELHRIYGQGVEAMKQNLSLFQKFSLQLAGISNVLEVMDSSFKGTSSAQLSDLHHLSENVLKAKQHLEVMTWCARHQFLEDVEPCHSDFQSWTSHVYERKLAASKRSWPGTASIMEDPAGHHDCSLFIEQALSNLGIEQSSVGNNEDVDIFCLQDRSSPLIFNCTIDVADRTMAVGCYPFKSLRAATDILFLYGTSDMVVAKQAILLYYLFDRHWTEPDNEWRHLVDDFATCFGLSRHLVLESLAFYLLDDHTDQSLKDACNLLPEIASPETHRKVAQILLERQRPDVALNVLRCTGRDAICANGNSEHDGVHYATLGEAVTAVRVRIECGLLTEAFMYHRMHCSKMKGEESKIIPSTESSNIHNSDSWVHQIEVLVTEICYLCIRRNLVDRMVELPWDGYEEKYIHKCLFDHACQDPSTVCGSLLVVFYLQRYRYKEAYRVDYKLRDLENNVLESATVDVASKIRTVSQWRAKLIDNCLKLLPDEQRLQVMTGDMVDDDVFPSLFVQTSSSSDYPDVLPNPATAGIPMSIKSSVILHTINPFTSLKPSAHSNVNTISSTCNANMDLGTKVPSVLQRRPFASETPIARPHPFVDGFSSFNPSVDVNSVSGVNISRDYRHEDVVRQGQGFQSVRSIRSIGCPSVSPSASLKDLSRSALEVGENENQFQVGRSSYGMASFDCTGYVENSVPVVPKVNSEDSNKLMDTFHSKGFLNDSIRDQNLKVCGKQNLLDRPWNKIFSEEANRNTWSSGEHDPLVLDANIKGGLRWRLDESTDEVDDRPGKNSLSKSSSVTRRRARFSR